MAFLPESAHWEDGIYQYEITDKLQSGPDGIDNLQGKQLANRTVFLKEEILAESKEREKADGELQAQISMMKGRGGYLEAHDFGSANPTQQQLTDYALAEIKQTDPALIWHGTHVKNLNDGNVWVLNNQPGEEPPIFEWINDGPEGIGVADNDGVLGLVSGGHDFDSVYIDPQGKMRVPGLIVFKADQVEGYGRDLMKVILGHGIEEMTTQALRNEAIAEVMANIRYRCNNNGEIDGSGIPDFRGLAIADFLDGLDLSAIGAPPGGDAPQAWNNTYKNNRLLLGGFNTYKHSGETEVTKNHIVMVTRHNIARGRMNATDVTTGGFLASELRAWVDGAAGNGDGSLATGLKAALGGNNPLVTRMEYFSNTPAGGGEWANTTVSLLDPRGVFGEPGFSAGPWDGLLSIHLPIYGAGAQYRVKRWNGGRHWWWLTAISSASSASSFCHVHYTGASSRSQASAVGGVAPAFCVA